MRTINLIIVIVLACIFVQCKNVEPPKAILPVPTEAHLKWHEMERNAFIHFGLNTFNDMEWGYGETPASTFDPSELDANQWCEVIKKAGLKGIVLTCKHHDGFCLWPSEYTEYSVKNSPWRGGKGDLVKEVSDACRKHGLKFGVYLSPWDRNSPIYGTPEYITYFRNQLTELLTNYGDIYEVWFDGANGGTGYYGGANERRGVDRKTYYDWPMTNAMVTKLQPEALIFSDGGPGIRWCGNEHGVAGETNWNMISKDGFWPGCRRNDELNAGQENGTDWVPAEINVSVRPGWFYHKSEDHKVKSVAWLVNYYYESVGRNGTGLLNFPVDHRGLIHEIDAENVIQWQKHIEADLANNLLKDVKIKASNVRGNSKEYNVSNLIDGNKSTYWATDDNITSGTLEIDFKEPTSFNRFLVQEYIKLGQRVKAFTLEITDANGEWKQISSQTTIGYKRILRFPTVTSDKVRFTIKSSKACPLISNIEMYHAPKLVTTPEISRSKNGLVTIETTDKELDIYYTIDGAEPTVNSKVYKKEFLLDRKVVVKAIAVDVTTNKKSPVAVSEFDMSKALWSVVNSQGKKANLILDGLANTAWHKETGKMPVDLIIDLGDKINIEGFKYLPDQQRRAKGIIFNYRFQTSINGKKWKTVSSGEFSNIQNSPIWQIKNFPAVPARFVKLTMLSNTVGDKKAGYAEFDIITK